MKVKVNKSFFCIEYLFIFFSITWPIIGRIFSIDQAGRVVDMLMVVSIFKLFSSRAFLKRVMCFPVIVWGVWILYAFIQFTFMHNPALGKDIYVHYFSMLSPWVIMLIVIDKIVGQRLNEILTVIFFSLLLFAVLSSVSVGSNITEETRTMIEYKSDPNDVALAAAYSFFVLILKFQLKKVVVQKFALFSSISLFIVLYMASRTALLAVVVMILSMAFVYIFKNDRGIKHKIITAIAMFCFIGLFTLFVTNSFVSERIVATNDDIKIQTGTVLDILGDRGPFYYFGFFEFIQHPVFGIGIKNFGPNNVYNELICHSEFMVNLTETGIVGALIFWTFLFSLLYCCLSIPKTSLPFDKLFIWMALFVPIFVGVFFWTYDRSYIFFSYALIIAFYRKNQLVRQSYSRKYNIGVLQNTRDNK